MSDCPEYLVPPGFQLQSGGATGPVDCTAWSASRVIGVSTCGGKVPSGRRIRLESDEPRPDPKSPGLNIPQVADVSRETFGVYLDQRCGYRALDWDEYEELRISGRPLILQGAYAPLADTKFDAGRGFRAGHAFAETQHSTYDSLADGRAQGVWEFDGRLYPRDLMREAAGDLVIGTASGKPVRVGRGKAWCAVGYDSAPNYSLSVQPRKGRRVRHFRRFYIASGRIIKTDVRETVGFAASCDPPRAFRWDPEVIENRDYRFLVRITSGQRDGWWVRDRWADPVRQAKADALAEQFDAYDPDGLDYAETLTDIDDADESFPDVPSDPVEEEAGAEEPEG